MKATLTKRMRASAVALAVLACALFVVFVVVRTGTFGSESVKEALDEIPQDEEGGVQAIVQEATHGSYQGHAPNKMSSSGTPDSMASSIVKEVGVKPSMSAVNTELMAAPSLGNEKACRETYGFLPCSESVGGSIFLMLAYGAVLMFAATCIGDGGEAMLDLEIMPPAIIGGILLPVLGAVPDAVIVAVSGLARATKVEVERKIAVGIGTLAGSTIMLLCVALPSSLFVGRCDIEDKGEGPVAVDQVLDGQPSDAQKDGYCQGFSSLCQHLYRTGISHDNTVLRIKWFMAFTSLGYLVVQGPAFSKDKDVIHTSCLVGAIVCFVLLIVYLIDSVFSAQGEEKIQMRKKERRDFLEAVVSYQKHSASKLELIDASTGSVNKDAVRELFNVFDADGNGHLDAKETETFARMVFKTSGQDSVPADVLQELHDARQADVDVPSKTPTAIGCGGRKKEVDIESGVIDVESFIELVARLLNERVETARTEKTDDDDEEEGEADAPPMSFSRALFLIVLGTALVTLFSDSMVDAIDSFGRTTGVPNFISGFVICPYVSNASELISSLQFAARKKKKNASVCFSQIYAACTMNNCLCLGVFFGVVWLRNLDWNYAVEVFSIVLITWFVAVLTCTRTTIPLWMGAVISVLYPLSLALVEVLHRLNIK